MKNKNWNTLLIGHLFLLAITVSCGTKEKSMPRPETQLLITNVNVVDVENDTVLLAHDIGIRADTIVFIAPTLGKGQKAAKGTTLDGQGKYAIPSLWDMHAHPQEKEELNLYVATGVLGIRCMWGFPFYLDWRKGIETNTLVGPDIITAGKIMEGTPPPEFSTVVDTVGRAVVDTPEDALRAIEAQVASGYDFIKVYNNMPEEAYDALIQEANARDITVAGHVPFEVGLMKAMNSQRSIEHLRGYIQHLIDENAQIKPGIDFRSRELSWEYINEEIIEELAQKTAESGVYNCVTLLVADFLSPQATMDKLLQAPQMTYVAQEIKDLLKDRKSNLSFLSNVTDEDYQKIASLYPKKQKLVKALADHGAPILAGTDVYGFNAAGFSLHDELIRLNQSGLDAYETLRTATLYPAQYFEKEAWWGSIAPGKQANLILLETNPIANIANTKNIATVIQKGKVHDRAFLDSILAKAVK